MRNLKVIKYFFLIYCKLNLAYQSLVILLLEI